MVQLNKLITSVFVTTFLIAATGLFPPLYAKGSDQQTQPPVQYPPSQAPYPTPQSTYPPPPSPQQQPVPQPQTPPTVGTINYMEGQASVNNQALAENSIGNVVFQAGQTLTTANNGKVEILLTPGVFLRVGGNSAIRMVSPSLSNTEIAVDRGDATVEVAEIQKENNIVIDVPNGKTRIVKTGFYEFDINQNTVRVFKGEAELTVTGRKEIKITGDHQVALNDPRLKSTGFDKTKYDTADLYRWSVLRSSYLAEANVNTAAEYANTGNFVPGWYWDPWFGAFTWIPGEGIWDSPFGWGFYSPYYVYDAPLFYYGYYGGGAYRRHFGPDFHAWGPGPHYGPHPIWHGNSFNGTHAYRGFGGGLHMNGGFRGVGGGFHGGGSGHAGGGHGR